MDSPGFEITGKLTIRGIGPRGDFEKITPQKLTNIENILTPWSLAQVDSICKKNWRSTISLDCPFKRRHACNVAWYEEEPQGPQVRNSRYLRGHVVPEAVQNHMGLPYLCTDMH